VSTSAGAGAWPTAAAARGLEREPQTGVTALAGGGPAAAHSQEPKAGTARRWLGALPPGRASPQGFGHGLPVRRHGRWPQTQVPESHRT